MSLHQHPRSRLSGWCPGAASFPWHGLSRILTPRRPLGVIMADADTVAIDRIIESIGLDNAVSLAAILDDKGKLIYASGPIPDQVKGTVGSKESRHQYESVERPITTL